MAIRETNPQADSHALALQALVWTLSDVERAQRLLDVTGLDPRALRQRAGDPVVLAAALGFLESHEPDLLACAGEIGVSPTAIVDARRRLEAE